MIILPQLFVPMNVCDNHWLLVVLNFKKKEIQVLNSLPYIRDEVRETKLVSVLSILFYITMGHNFLQS